MTVTNDTYVRDLNQIREKQLEVLEEIDEIQKRHGILPHEIEKIQGEALAIIHEIEQIQQRRQGDVEMRPVNVWPLPSPRQLGMNIF